MVSAKILVVGVLAAVAAAVPRPNIPQSLYGPPTEKEPGMPFEFSYTVKDDYTGNDFGHDETSDGQVTSGTYHVLLPDGRLQTVTFTANHEDGYVAHVNYKGEASYPRHTSKTYGPPTTPSYPKHIPNIYEPPTTPSHEPPTTPSYEHPTTPSYPKHIPNIYEPPTTPSYEHPTTPSYPEHIPKTYGPPPRPFYAPEFDRYF